MKLRLEPCDHTEEDTLAWAHVIWGHTVGGSTLWTRSLMQDRRDANLMLMAAEMRVGGWGGGLTIENGDLNDFIDCGGTFTAEMRFLRNITYYA